MKKKKPENQRSHEKPISLEPLTPDEVLKALLSTPAPEHEKDKEAEKN